MLLGSAAILQRSSKQSSFNKYMTLHPHLAYNVIVWGCGMLVLDIIVSTFAAFGVFCSAKFLADGYITPKYARPRPAVRLNGNESPSEIAALCENARKTIICNRGEIILLVSKEGKFAESVRKELSELGLHDVYVAIETDKTT